MRRSPRETAESQSKITRRGLILGGAQLGFMGVLAARMRFMQVEQADQFRLLAEENRVNLRLLPPTRGLILDRAGVILARNEQNYRIVLVREAVRLDLAYLGLALFLIYLFWTRIAQIVYALSTPFMHKTPSDFLSFMVSTPDGITMALTGTVIGAPVSVTASPRTRPSDASMAMVRTVFSPRCCATSSTRRWPLLSHSKAFRMAGRWSSNWTSTTAPMT